MKKTRYNVPICEECPSSWESVLCTSDPELGGSEDVGYEDWVIEEQV
ncbi:MAG: hypothetical protein J5737_00535 [Bacteroidales bacterium]|nr:hypothetical protein [Bacteroidales bacterium]